MNRTRAGVGLAILALVASALVVTPAHGQSSPEGLRLVAVQRSLLGVHYSYRQTFRGLDVLDGRLDRHVFDDGETVAADSRRAIAGDVATTPTVSRDRAMTAAGSYARHADLAVRAGSPPRLVWAVYAVPPTGTTRTLVDAHDGTVLSVAEIAWHADGTGRVFDPNPVVTLRDPSLQDNDDADHSSLAPAYRTVQLRRLDGSGFLRGDFAVIGLPEDELAHSLDNTFDHPRSSPFFEQVMAYYHVTTSQEYIQTLGFRDIQNSPQTLLPNVISGDNSFYDPFFDEIVFGTGGVDDAEDADVIWHEYGHAIQEDQIPGFGASQDARAIGEGFADYWAVTMSQPVNGGYDVPCMADWDALGFRSGIQCLTRTDTDLTVADRNGSPHHDGQIWSRALWDINQALGRDDANMIVLEAQFRFASDTSFEAAALATVDSALRLFGPQAAGVVRQAFEDRGILQRTPPGLTKRPVDPVAGPGLHEIARLDSRAPGGGFHIEDFEPYGLNDRQQALFAADLLSDDFDFLGEGVYRRDLDGTAPLARSGDPAPGGGTYGIGVMAGSALNARGDAAFGYFLQPFRRPTGRNGGLYRARGDVVAPIVVPGETPSPTGGHFVGVGEAPSIDDFGQIAFAGMIETEAGISPPYGMGIFLADSFGRISPVAAPGDPVPGQGVLDYAVQPSLNSSGDLVFAGHLAGRPCLATVPQSFVIGCVRDLFLRSGATGKLTRLVAAGDPAPGGGIFRSVSFPLINARRDVLFQAVVNTGAALERGLFLRRDGKIIAVARVGHEMPGGGELALLASQPGNWDLNDRGDVSFSATLRPDSNQDGLPDQGIYRWTAGVTSLVIRTGMAVPGGEILLLQPPLLFGTQVPFSGAVINENRQVLFAATVTQPAPQFAATVLYVSS